MEDESIVSKAKVAFHSAAAKAEQVFADFKSDLQDSDDQFPEGAFGQFEDLSFEETLQQKASSESKQFRWRPPSIGTKQEWHERLKSFGKGRKGDDAGKVDSPKMAFAVYDENLFLYNEKVALEKGWETPSLTSDVSNKEIIPPASVLKQLALAIESERMYSSVKDILLSTNSSPVRERASMSISAVKSFVLRGKGEKVTSEFSDDEAWSFIQSILDSEGLTPSRRVGFLVDALPGTTTLPREIRGAPPESLIVKVSEVIGSFKMLRKMALFWCRIVSELRRLWWEEQYIPGIPHDKVPDLSCCLLYQQMQLMNCCVSRKKRRDTATSSLESLIIEAGYDPDRMASPIVGIKLGSNLPYAKTNTGEHVLRLGASHQSDNLTMLETGEAIYAPVTQEGPVLTEDLAQEAEELVLRTGSVGAGCSQLLSDMQAFKAANPGCILEDFVRWYSPPDWTENENSIDSDAGSRGGDSTPTKGRLSRRMQKAGNLWRTFWETSKPVPAVRQAPLFDEDLAMEGVFTALERISPSQLFGQLFLSVLGLGFVIAESKLSTDENMGKLFYECKEYVVAACQSEAWIEKIDDLCQVYETMEAMLMRPEDVIKMLKLPRDTNVPEEPKHRFKKFTEIFGGINRPKKSSPETQKNPDDSPNRSPLSNFFDRRSFSFSKKSTKDESPQSQMNKPNGQDENDWTVI